MRAADSKLGRALPRIEWSPSPYVRIAFLPNGLFMY